MLDTFFSDFDFKKDRVNNNVTVWELHHATKADFDKVCDILADGGFLRKENGGFCDGHFYSSFVGNGNGIFVNFFDAIGTLTAAFEKDCNYFDFSDTPADEKVSPLVTQVHLQDFGMSYVIRLSDGRFIVIDGGREFEPDADELYKVLCDGTENGKITIAAWIMTHAHEDHYLCFNTFFDKYGENVAIERFMYEFPESDNVERFPEFSKSDMRVEYNTSVAVQVPKMQERIQKSGAKFFTLHTGQEYRIGDVKIRVLASIDDIICDEITNFNYTSAVFTTEIANQKVLWTGDAGMGFSRLPEKYGAYLKSDILQIPHHGFETGDSEEITNAYKLIKPSVCFLPVSFYNAYIKFCIHKESTRFIMQDCDTDEIITGDVTKTITLPYSSPTHKKSELERNIRHGLSSSGCKTWVFTGLSTANADDFVFTVLNMTNVRATVKTELFFKDPSRNLAYLTAHIESSRFKTFSITGEEIDDNTMWFNWMSLKKRGIPENAEFAVRFISDHEIVVSHKDKKETYRA